jgi:predicted CXXCH cytochrome family protein
MKKVIILVAALSLLTAGVAFAELATGPHDLQSGDQSVSGVTQKCKPCHVPHNPNALSPPLWNHSNAATGGYTIYSSATIDGATGQPGAESAACMGCHDGTVALDAFGGGTPSQTITGGANIGTNLRDDHPVGITYDTSADDALKAIAGLNVTLFAGDKVECGSCHDVHDYSNVPFLRMTLTSSVLCLDCHNK